MFRVEWEADASDQFAALSMLHLDRWTDINAADTDIDYKLQRDPMKFSQPVSEGLRRIISDPLIVYFTISDNAIVVEAIGWLDP